MSLKTNRTTSFDVVKQMLAFLGEPIVGSILEPSSGDGKLIENMLTLYPYLVHEDFDCVELNKENRKKLKEKGFNVIGEDFFNLNPLEHTKRYDLIIAAPTYKDNVDVEHIIHMYNFLKIDGVILSLTQPYWTVRNNENQIKFRKWLEDKKYVMKMLHDNSFIENYTTQPSIIIKITK